MLNIIIMALGLFKGRLRLSQFQVGADPEAATRDQRGFAQPGRFLSVGRGAVTSFPHSSSSSCPLTGFLSWCVVSPSSKNYHNTDDDDTFSNQLPLSLLNAAQNKPMVRWTRTLPPSFSSANLPSLTPLGIAIKPHIFFYFLFAVSRAQKWGNIQRALGQLR